MGKLLGRLGSLTFERQLVEEKENSEFKPVVSCLKIVLVLHPTHDRGLLNTDIVSDINPLLTMFILNFFIPIWH